ncbi:MAG: sodium/proline symporter [Bacteroidales bacterium]|nr:sodium/proline symporter [Bacteroidales bacterium]MBN2698789.1 sodium/proline symporter [Bacteroidales bacterium]
MNFTLLGFIIYLIIILVVGFLTFRRNKSHQDFFIAGRRLNPWLVAFSERASGESAWLLLGLPGAAYAAGLIEFWTALGCVLGVIFYWFYVARDLRNESEKYQAITIPGFLANRFGKGQSAIRILATFIIVFFYIFYLSAQFNGAGKILSVTFGIDQTVGMIIGAGVIIFYTMMGGFFAVAWTDMIQGIIMIGALIILPLAGFLELTEQETAVPHFNNLLNEGGLKLTSLTGGAKGWTAAALIISGLSWAFGYMGQPHLLTRFMSINESKNIKLSRRIAIAWVLPAFAGAIMIGLLGAALYGQGRFDDIEKIMPHMAVQLLPAWIAGILVSGAIAAMMSTADSQLLVISSSVIEDFFHQTLGKDVSDIFLLKASRMITIIIGLTGFIIGVASDKLIFSMVSYAWAGLGASFGPVLLLILKWKKVTRQGVQAGLITGFLTTVIWSEIKVLDQWISVRFVSFMISLLVVFAVSRLTFKTPERR